MIDSSQARDQLATCIGQLRSRTPEQGNDTDHVSALRQALSYLDDGSPQPKIVFLLTDGRLDVSNSEFFGRNSTPEERNEAAADQIPDLRAEFERISAQVWPLGFGQVPGGALDAFTTGASCSPQEPPPSARVIAGSEDLGEAVRQAFRSATCVGIGPIVPQSVPSGGTATLRVEIPPFASDASILVYKRNVGVTVTAYRDPNGQPVTGTSGPSGASFEIAGQGTETESLRIVDPMPGLWSVDLESGPAVPPQEVAATVLYQGAVNATVAARPSLLRVRRSTWKCWSGHVARRSPTPVCSTALRSRPC